MNGLRELSRRQWLILNLLGASAFLSLWYFLAYIGVTPQKFLPTPLDVVQRFFTLSTEPFVGMTLFGHLASSFHRFLSGFGLAVAIGVPLGLLMATSKVVDRIVTPVFESIRFVAPIAWIPFAALWFGTGMGGPVLIIFMGAFPPVLINTYRGSKYVDVKYLEAAWTLGASRFRVMTEVLMPAAVPSIVAGLRVSAGLGWQSLVGAELIAASSGVGYMMVKGQQSIDTSTVMSGMLAIGIVGLLIDILLRKLQERVSQS